MRFRLFALLIFCLGNKSYTQTIYESPLGFTVNFNQTWKKVPNETMQQNLKTFWDFLGLKEGIRFDACYQKIDNSIMNYPYILLRNEYSSTTYENEIKKIQEYFTNKSHLDSLIENIVNDRAGIKLEIGKSYYDIKNKIFIFIFDNIKGNLVGMSALYIGKTSSLAFYCYSHKEDFKKDQKDFLDVIYSVKEENTYDIKHKLAIEYYNEGKIKSQTGNWKSAIELYSKAIENYPKEDSILKSEAYYNRGLNNRYLNNLKNAISDYTEAIKFNHSYYKAYNNRGFVKLQTGDYAGAILDFTQTIKYDNYNTEATNMALGSRGLAKFMLNQNGCLDLKKAIEAGNKNVIEDYNELCK